MRTPDMIVRYLDWLSRKSPFFERDSNVYVVLVSRRDEDEMGAIEGVPLANGTQQLAAELQEAWDGGVAGDFQVVGRLTHSCTHFEQLPSQAPTNEED